ncbi:MAG: hypothetical protein V7698_18120 [Paracoccaceae bacterium]
MRKSTICLASGRGSSFCSSLRDELTNLLIAKDINFRGKTSITMPIVAIRTLADLRSAVHVGAIGVANISTADLYLDLAEGLLGAEFACGNLVESIEAFEKRFPNEFNASIIPGFDDDVLYRKWRSFILKLLRLAGHAEGVDPVIHLNIFAKREGIVPINQAVYRRAFPDLPPAKVSRETAIEFDRPLRGLERQMFRQVTTTLDRLRTIAEVTQLGLLGPGSIGPLPKYAHGAGFANSRTRISVIPGHAFR